MTKFFVFYFLLIHSLYAVEGETIPETLTNDFISPATDVYRNYFLYAAGAIALGEIFFQKEEKSFQRSVSTSKPLGSFSHYGDLLGQGIPNALYFVGMEVGGRRDLSALMLRTTLISGFTTTVLKYTIREKRPDSNNRNSFPSGHTTTAFAFASVVGSQHGAYYGIPAYAMATFVGFSRINDNKHYLFDVAAGALIGTMYGMLICNREQKKENDNNVVKYDLIPSIGNKKVGINVQLSY